MKKNNIVLNIILIIFNILLYYISNNMQFVSDNILNNFISSIVFMIAILLSAYLIINWLFLD